MGGCVCNSFCVGICVDKNKKSSTEEKMSDLKQGLTLTIHAQTSSLKALFRKKEDVEAILKESGTFENCASGAIFKAFQFAFPHLNTFEFENEKEDNVSPIVRIYLSLYPEQIQKIEDCFSILKSQSNRSLTTFDILSALFDFILERRHEFHSFLGSDFEQEKVKMKSSVIDSHFCQYFRTFRT